MSHNKLRSEKNCLNCGSHVEERYCGHCGQENLQIQDSAFHLVIHYIQDLFHYDGKLWHTLKNLITKPGLVAAEYMEGKRLRNLEPIRFYVFASTIFFLLLFSFMSGDETKKEARPEENYTRRLYHLNREKKFLGNHPDTTYINLLASPLQMKRDSVQESDSTGSNFTLDFTGLNEDTTGAGWLEQLFFKRAEARRLEMEEKHSGDPDSALQDFLNELFHKFPILLFMSMPFFALFLKILYFRSGRKRYVQHFIFAIYHYAFLFVMSSFLLGSQFIIKKLFKNSGEDINDTALAVFVVYFMIYLWLSMKRFYSDRWYYRLPKYLVLLFALFIVMLILFLFFFFFTLLG